MDEYIKIALSEANKAYLKGEIPIGVVIISNNKIIAKTHNLKEKYKCATKHAEILAIEKTSKLKDSWRLNDCEMIVTMEPCIMCCGALIQSRIKKVYYLVSNEKFGGISTTKIFLKNDKNNHTVEFEKIDNKEYEEKSINMLRDFFKDKR